MPELPEVEVICRGIRPLILGRSVKKIWRSGKKLRSDVPVAQLNDALCGATIVRVTRRAKYLLVHFRSSVLLIFHFGMTGNLGIFDPRKPPARHDHLRLLFDNNTELRFNDTRRFGSIHLFHGLTTSELESTFFKTTGPEPFSADFTPEYLHTLARKRKMVVKSFIMTNRVVAGIGNIYANESLFLAGIHPADKIDALSLEQWEVLTGKLRSVLENGIECGGSTISDFVNAGQESGYFQMNFKVYGRAGQKCFSCGSLIEKQTIGGRASFYCPACQRPE
ncbi:bifunctional DNA-formamidopyrimidine glycosylase/DNA-(apurinic or apyrimidinic site) lyase [Desulfomarina sp.]